MNVLLSSSN